MKPIVISLFLACGLVAAQTVSGQVSGGGQTATAAASFKKVTLSSIGLANPSVVGGVGITGTIVLTDAAPGNSVSVALSSSNATVASVPATVPIPNGATSATFAITTTAVTASTPVTLTATLGSATATVVLTVVPVLTATMACAGVPQNASGNYLVLEGQPVSCTITVNLAPTAAVTVPLTSADTTQFTVPASVVIAAGATTSPAFSVTATP